MPAEIPGKAEAAKNTAATTAIESLESIREPINPPHKPETAPTRRYSVALLNILHTTIAREAWRAARSPGSSATGRGTRQASRRGARDLQAPGGPSQETKGSVGSALMCAVVRRSPSVQSVDRA